MLPLSAQVRAISDFLIWIMVMRSLAEALWEKTRRSVLAAHYFEEFPGVSGGAPSIRLMVMVLAVELQRAEFSRSAAASSAMAAPACMVRFSELLPLSIRVRAMSAFVVRIMVTMSLAEALWGRMRLSTLAAHYFEEIPGATMLEGVIGLDGTIGGKGITGHFLDPLVLVRVAINVTNMVTGLPGVEALKGPLSARRAHCDPIRMAHCQGFPHLLAMLLMIMVMPLVLLRLALMKGTKRGCLMRRITASG